ncbi:hypothetical protein [Fusibacter ferrireducens]|uniref:Uncharacterized protein n=1 Tax=Fusibacter ferrireducens TaxID=2785058 RepID=A0ABR9ZRL4_9FIRM|nr:hypothetical protein [Fusibacter ferrireducens]MBF4693102.1 hypothetical protein [Fusibacter ferrireducens]
MRQTTLLTISSIILVLFSSLSFCGENDIPRVYAPKKMIVLHAHNDYLDNLNLY